MICSQELLFCTGIGAVGRFVSENYRGQPAINTVSSSHVETVVLLSQLKQKPDDYINVTIELDDMDITSAETKATYDEIKKYVAEHNAGMKASNLYISQVKRKCGIEVGTNYNLPKETLNKSSAAGQRIFCFHAAVLKVGNTQSIPSLLIPCLETKSLAASSCRFNQSFPKNEDSRQPQCPEDQERAIVEALKHFKMNR